MNGFLRRTLTSLGYLAIAGACFTFTVRKQNEYVRNLKRIPPFFETWELAGRSGTMFKYLSLGYDDVMANGLWIRAIQSFGGRGMTNRDWRPLYNLFDTITELDPYMEPAYTFGNLVIGDEGGHQVEGLSLLDKGLTKNYLRYRCAFEGLYVSHWSLKDPKRAAWYGRVATKRKDAPDWLPRITAFVEVASGQYYIGFDRYLGNLLQSIDQNSPVLIEIALNKLIETVDQWNMATLAPIADAYTTGTGRVISPDLHEIVNDPKLKDFESASISRTMAAIEILRQRLNKEPIPDAIYSRIGFNVATAAPKIVAAQQELAKELMTMDLKGKKNLSDFQNVIFQAALHKTTGIPEDPYGSNYTANQTLVTDMSLPAKERYQSLGKVEQFLQDLLKNMRRVIRERKAELGHDPKDFREAFYTDLRTTEPLGGRFVYPSPTGDVQSTSRPNM